MRVPVPVVPVSRCSRVIGDATTFAKVNTWAGLPADHTWTLCYKATRDNANTGFIAYANYGAIQFHSRCDNHGATFFVAKTAGGVLFGGYTPDAWTGEAPETVDGASMPAPSCFR